MSQKLENLSALVDGENGVSSSSNNLVLDAVKNDTELQLKWKSYHLIRDGLRQELPANINFDIADKIAQAIEAEPAILAPKKTWRDLPLVSNIVPFAKQGGQMAIAASVAVAMIIGVQQLNQADVNQPFNAAPPIPGIQGGLSPVSFDQTRAIPNSGAVEQKRRINAYMTDHKQQLRFKTIESVNDKSAIMNQDIKNQEAQSDIVENTPQ
ncbi:sigma-E factor negative regulatory protein [Paraglaciecola sp. MB-3u-78]|uniref:sigma-E factor negative regulatory protein n=1 Tax=Paraglaciecola sp. MB-3u-78 TaxID=2058332 RepID=UPI000C34048F|nr:RseA family anti-sigma factor [Paraglaciecola sp. MB-3u-78]PKH00627.1 transcriptional regulator [Paraglaciecola sp. MB-3u-78]